MSATPEPGTTKALLEMLLKPFTLIFNPIAERIGGSLRRKPKLHIHVHPLPTVWCYAWDGYGESAKPMMQVRFTADITNDSPDESVLVLDGYVEGTRPKLPITNRIEVPPTTTVQDEIICVFCTPVVGEGGKDFTGKVILIDQLKRKHRTDKITFTWVGSAEPPKPPTPPAPPSDPK